MAQYHDSSWRYTGTRSQFRVSGLSPFKNTCPIHFTDIMETGQEVPQAHSPVRGTTRTVREYEDTIDKFRKENLDLKMRLYLLEVNRDKNFPKFSTPPSSDTIEVVLNLKNETEALQNELGKYASENKELQDRLLELEQELTMFHKLPSQEEFLLLQDEINNIKNENDSLIASLTEKDEKIEEMQLQIQEMIGINQNLEAKNKKSSLAIQGIVSKYQTEIIEIPKEFRSDIQDAIKAAKEDNEDKMVEAIERFISSLQKIMTPSAETSNENIQPEDADSFSKHFSITSLRSSNQSLNRSDSNVALVSQISEENEALRQEVEEQSQAIKALNSICDELRGASALKEFKHPVSTSDVTVQTTVQWQQFQSSVSEKLLQSAGHSNNIDDLREEILMLLLVIEEKDKEISKSEKVLSSLQEKINYGSQNISYNMDADFVSERNDLHDRLARSCNINNQLMMQLKSLRKFLEELLQHNSINSSSHQDISETSIYLSQLAKTINESMKLGASLSDNLSVCENSRIFDPDDMSYMANESTRPLESTHLGNEAHNVSESIKTGTTLSNVNVPDARTGKRKLSFNTQYTSATDLTTLNSNNCVVVETSNNEDVILLLNDQGDPEDVLIRNNQNKTISGNGKNWQNFSTNNQLLERNYQQVQAKSYDIKPIGLWRKHCWSSDSDIWSEPDREVSIRRIGIDVQVSPSSQKSPRKSRHRRSTDDQSTEKNASTSSPPRVQTWSRRRRSGEFAKPYICKKCKMLSSDESLKENKMEDLHSTIEELKSKNDHQESELQEIKKKLKEEVNVVESMTTERKQLLHNLNKFKSDLGLFKEEKKVLTVENSKLNEELSHVNKNNDILDDVVKKLQRELSDSNALHNQITSELKQTREKLYKLEEAYSKCEEMLQLSSERERDYEENLRKIKQEHSKNEEGVQFSLQRERSYEDKLRKLEENFSISEKKVQAGLEREKSYAQKLQKLEENYSKSEERMQLSLESEKDFEEKLRKIKDKYSKSEEKLQSSFKREKDYEEKFRRIEKEQQKSDEKIDEMNLIHKNLSNQLENETSHRNMLEKENYVLNQKINEKFNEIELLRSSIENINREKMLLMKRNEASESNLQASTNLTEILQSDLKELQKNLKILHERCVSYEEKLSHSSQKELDFGKSLLNLKADFVSNLEALQSLSMINLESDNQRSIPRSLSESDKDKNVEQVFDSIVFENAKFKRIVDMLSQKMKEIVSRLQQLNNIEKDSELALNSMLRQLESKEKEVENLKAQNERLRLYIEELQKEVKQNEVSSSKQEKNLKEQLDTSLSSFQSAYLEREKQLEESNAKVSTLQAKVHALQNKIQKYESYIESRHLKTSQPSFAMGSSRPSSVFNGDPRSPSKLDASDRESAMSEEIINLSRSVSPASFENFPLKSRLSFSRDIDKDSLENIARSTRESGHKVSSVRESQDSLFQRSQYSSPDLGIESDANHESSAPELAERDRFNGRNLRRPEIRGRESFYLKEQQRSDDFKENQVRIENNFTIHAIGVLEEYLLLKKEVQESLVAIRSVLSRTGDGLKHIGRQTSPRKNLQYDTFKAIKDTCVHIEVCLNKAYMLVGNFWTSPFIPETELKKLLRQNSEFQDDLKRIHDGKKRQEIDFKDAMERLKHAEMLKENMEKKISRKLVKTKKVIQQMERKLLEKESTSQVPRFPFEQTFS